MEYNAVKVFGIGLTRTGTTSLAAAMQEVGYMVAHYPSRDYLFEGLYNSAYDLSVVIDYKALDQRFPGSKFIYTVREKNGWLDSMEQYLEGRETASRQQRINRKRVYGQSVFDRKIYSAAYDRHHNDVLAYFKTRPQDLLILNICGGEGWKPLLSFLNIEVSVDGFPRKHQQSYD